MPQAIDRTIPSFGSLSTILRAYLAVAAMLGIGFAGRGHALTGGRTSPRRERGALKSWIPRPVCHQSGTTSTDLSALERSRAFFAETSMIRLDGLKKGTLILPLETFVPLGILTMDLCDLPDVPGGRLNDYVTETGCKLFPHDLSAASKRLGITSKNGKTLSNRAKNHLTQFYSELFKSGHASSVYGQPVGNHEIIIL